MRESLWTKNFILLTCSNLFLFLAIEMLLPTLPVFAAEQGSSESQIGLLLGCFTFAAVLARPLTGIGVRRFGKKGLLLIGVAICFVGMAGYYMAATLTALLLLRFVHGIGFGLSTTQYGTVISDVVPASRRGEGMGFFATGNAIAFSLGPFLGIWLMEQYGYSVLFATGAAILLATLALTTFFRQPKASPDVKLHASAASQGKPHWLSSAVEKKALFPSLLGMLVGVSFGGMLSFITLFGIEKGISNIGYFFLVVAICEVLIRFVSGPLFDRKGRIWVLFPSAVFCLIGCVVLFLADSVEILLLAGVFYGFGFGALFPALQAWVINRVEPERRGAATATYYNFFDIGIGLGAIMLGFVASVTGYATMFLFSGIFFVAYIVLYLYYEWKYASGGKRTANIAE
ncbi:MFS transporter [Paenibacillus sp. NPDC058071]|uniref:MFS transporter n=1 Tax=Paenibacillus sp. NPDC058071 TaxID=3346326 RepID=UPI0036DBE9CF